MNALERGGSQLEDCDLTANLKQLSIAIDRQWRLLPEAIRREVDSGIRRELRDHAPSRESISMGGR
jgi:hypothetical protein